MLKIPDEAQNTSEILQSRPDIIRARSPLRISFVGGGTDLPHWYEKQPGATLSSTINRYAHVSLYPRNDQEVHINSYAMGYAVKYNLEEGPVYDGVLDLAKAAIHRMGVSRGMELDLRTDAPPGSGLGGSSAMTSALIGVISSYTGKNFSKYDIAELNHSIERIDLGIKGGKQDQYITTFGGFNLMEFYPDRVAVTPLRIDQDIINDLEAHLLLCYTGKARSNLGLIDKQIRLYQEGRQETIQGMTRLYKLVFEMKEALLRGHLHDLGEMLNEAYINKKKMNPSISEGTIADELYAEALRNGAIGGKLLGAGGGGYLMIYCEINRQHAVREALENLGGQFIDFSFERLGLQLWRSNSL